MDWGCQCFLHIPNLQVGLGHPVPGGPGAVNHTEHLVIHGVGGDREYFQILYIPH